MCAEISVRYFRGHRNTNLLMVIFDMLSLADTFTTQSKSTCSHEMYPSSRIICMSEKFEFGTSMTERRNSHAVFRSRAFRIPPSSGENLPSLKITSQPLDESCFAFSRTTSQCLKSVTAEI